MSEEGRTHPSMPSGLEDSSRRTFLRYGLVLPFLSVSLLIPTRVLAAAVKAQKTPVGKGSAAPAIKPVAPRLLMIDPGHGGHDPGAIGVSGVHEKDVVLDIARRMAEEMNGLRGVAAKLTRDSDVFLPLGDRAELGRKAKADLFISIHADSTPNHTARGLSVYTLSDKASDKFASMLADKENKVDGPNLDFHVQDKEVANILFDLTARRTRNIAQRVKVGFIKGIGRRWELLEQPMRAANFAVLRQPDVPAMLIETGFLSNPKDEEILSQAAERKKIASLMVDELAFLLRSPLFG